MKRSSGTRPLTFRAKLERIAETAEYYAFTVPLKISHALGTRRPVPVSVRLNDSTPYFVSLAPIGGGRHWLRVNAKARLAARIRGGELVRVRITVLDHATGVPVPRDLVRALQARGVVGSFTSMSLGAQNHTIKLIDEAARPETRARRIQAAVRDALRRRTRRRAESATPTR